MLSKKSDEKEKIIALVRKMLDLCPDCGSQLIHQEGIEICRSCGWQSVPG